MNNAIKFEAPANPVTFQHRDRARLVAELDAQRTRTRLAEQELFNSKQFYRRFIAILVLLIVAMYGGLWYAKTILQAACY